MYHEILVCLHGFPGGLLDKTANMVELATFIHPGERVLLKRILEVASEYKQLKSFIDLFKQDPRLLRPLTENDDAGNIPLQPGLYLQALCFGLDQALTPYRKEIVELESRFLADPHCTLTYVLSKITPHSTVVAALNVLVKEILSRKLHGCQLLQLLYQSLSTATDDVKIALQKALEKCHAVFFNQLSSWVLYGQMKDTLKEFFIQLAPEKTESESGVTNLEHQISPDLLPTYIPFSLAHKVLFVGQTIVMISNDPRDRNTETTHTNWLDRTDMDAVLWQDRGQQYFERLHRLQRSSLLDIGLFDETIEIIRSCVTEHLWVLAVEQAELLGQLRLIKDMFLLGRGELFMEFIQQAEGVLNRPPSSNFSRDVNQAFHSSAHKILLSAEESKMDKFYFSTAGGDDNGWTSLVLHYRVSWPLHLVFTPAVLDSYNQLFGFLLRVKKTQQQLHKLWQLQMVNKAKRWQDSRLWKIRTWLMFIVDHLQYYLQVDVLESQWAILVTALESTRDFEAVRRAHLNFLACTLSQTFLLLGSAQNEPTTTSYQKPESLKNNPVHNSIAGLLRLCERFCCCVASWGDLELTADQEEELTQLCRELEYLVQFLLQLLASLRSQPCGTHLAQLLLRLDFNRWFSQQCTGASLTGSLTGSITC